jgi:hypothetical protein
MTLHTKTSGLRPVRVQLVPALTYVMRTTADPASLIARIRAAAPAMDPDVPIAELSTLASYVSPYRRRGSRWRSSARSPPWRWAWRRSASTA